MPIWTLPGVPLREQFKAHAKESSPGYLYQRVRAEEVEEMKAELMATAKGYADDWNRMQYIGTADRRWLFAHGKDRGVNAIDGESDPDFRIRIRIPEDAVTRPVVCAEAQRLVDAAGIGGPAVECFALQPNKAFFGAFVKATRTDGGTFTKIDSTIMEFTPTTPFVIKPKLGRDKIEVAGSASNDTTRVIDSVVVNGLRYNFPAGADEVLGGGTVSVAKFNLQDNPIDGFTKAYFNRGFRIGGSLQVGVIILPFGCTEQLRLEVKAAAENIGLFGVLVQAECRLNP